MQSLRRFARLGYGTRRIVPRMTMAAPVQPALASHRMEIRPMAVRFYSGPPPPLTREFVEERILGVLSTSDKVSLYGWRL
jgi:hypothetical protein